MCFTAANAMPSTERPRASGPTYYYPGETKPERRAPAAGEMEGLTPDEYFPWDEQYQRGRGVDRPHDAEEYRREMQREIQRKNKEKRQ